MMTKVSFLFLLIFSNTLFAQAVGVNTTNPTATLDVNGTLRVRGTSQEIEIGVLKDSILVVSRSGVVNRVPGIEVIKAAIPTTVIASFSSGGNINHLLSLGNSVVKFDSEEIDYNNEFDLLTNTFTAKQDGIYTISAQIKINSAIAVSTDFGLGIYKNNVLIAEQNYDSVVVLGLNVSSPMRYVSTTLNLLETDTIQFRITSTLTNVDIIGNSSDSYCSIYQIR